MTPHEEREQLEAAIAERAAQIKRMETAEWCEARSCRTPEADTSVTKSAPATRRDQAMGQDISAAWRDYIATEVRAAERRAIEAVASATGEVLAELRKTFEARLEAEVLKLRNEFLQIELDRERGVKRSLKVVPADKDTLIA